MIVCSLVHDPFPSKKKKKKKSALRRGQFNLTFSQLYLMKKRHLDNRCARVKHARRPFKSCGSQNVKDACELADTRISTSLCRCSDPKGFISVMKRFSHQGWRRGAKTPPAVATILFLKRHEEICPFSATLLKCIYTLSSVSIVQNLFLISERGSLHFLLITTPFEQILCSPLNTCNHYLLQTGQKQLINHFAEYRIPWAVATFTNCLRFKANDGDFCSGALSDLFSSLASRVSVFSPSLFLLSQCTHWKRGEISTARAENRAAEVFAKPIVLQIFDSDAEELKIKFCDYITIWRLCWLDEQFHSKTWSIFVYGEIFCANTDEGSQSSRLW